MNPVLRRHLLRLPRGRRITAERFEEGGLVDPAPAAGLHPDFDVFARPGFDTKRVDPAVRAFYEETADLELRVRASWRGLLARSYFLLRPLLRRIGQIDFPSGGGYLPIRGQLVRLKGDALGTGSAPVAWIRRHGDDRVMYAAVHSVHRADSGASQQMVMDFSLPLPGGVLIVGLRLDGLDVGGPTTALGLTSFPDDDGEDVGTWYVTGGWALALPIRERITVWGADMPGAPAGEAGAIAVARHHFYAFGAHFLTLDYSIHLARDGAS